MGTIGALIIKYGPQILASAGVLIIRYIEKTKVIKHYKNKIKNILDANKD